MYQVTYKEAQKEIRLEAKNAGLVFKKANAKLNGKTAYKFFDRSTGQAKTSLYTLWTAYENVLTGFISSYDKDLKTF